MKEKQGIRWSASGHVPENSVRSVKSIVAEAILDAVTVLMFLLSARAMLYDVFRWGHFSVGLCVWIVLAVIGVSAVMTLSERWQEKRGRMMRGSVLLVGLLGFLIYYFFRTANAVIISSGIREVFSQFIDFWNEYYGTNIYVNGGITRNVSAALDFYLLLIGFVLFWVAKKFDKKFIVGILPAVAFSAELLVGYAPKITGLLFFVFAVILINVPHFKVPEFNLFPGKLRGNGKVRFFSWLPILLVAVLVSNVLVNVASPYADTIIANSRNIRETIQKWIGEPKGMGSIGTEEPSDNKNNSSYEWLSNDTPVYKHIPVITVTMERPAQGNIYLKEFYAGKYVDGRWEADVDSFENYFREKGYNPSQVSQEVLKREVNALAKTYGVEQLGQSIFGKRMNIYYLVHRTGRMAVPYFADFTGNDHIQMIGDGYYTRIGNVSDVSADVWYYENQYEDFLSLFENLESPLIGWGYDDYVQRYYLDVPNEMDTVRTLASTLYSDEMLPGVGSENELRLYKANLVAKWMQENTTYSLDLPDLPRGADAIEYFLGESKRGYCMHYASASVMLLREMGVPARLVTGYVVHKGDIFRANGGYSAQVKDDQAHAWVEIYLDGLGWFPVEVTKGYRTSIPDIPPNTETTQDDTTANDKTGASEEDTTAPDLTINDDKTKASEEDTQGYSEDDSSEVQSTTQDGNDGHEGGMDPERLKEIVRRVLLIVGSVLLTMVSVVIVIKLKREYQEELRRLIRRHKTSLAIRMMNRRIYRKLRMTGKIIRLNLRDDSYEEILKKNYPNISTEEWERYMNLVKAASFSKRDFSDEEVEFCYEIYRKVKPHS